jgi:hypothetical protein
VLFFNNRQHSVAGQGDDRSSFFDYVSERLAQQPECGLVVGFDPAHPLRFVMDDGAGGTAFEAAT